MKNSEEGGDFKTFNSIQQIFQQADILKEPICIICTLYHLDFSSPILIPRMLLFLLILKILKDNNSTAVIKL